LILFVMVNRHRWGGPSDFYGDRFEFLAYSADPQH